MKNIVLILASILLLLGMGCAPSMEVEEERIKQYLADNNLTGKAKKTESGIYYIVDVQGTGPAPLLTSTVVVNYTGTLTDGTKFDSSYDRGTPATFKLNGLIVGWQEGMQLFNEGGRGKIIIPSSLGYGNKKQGTIPRNSILIFDIELIEVQL